MRLVIPLSLLVGLLGCDDTVFGDNCSPTQQYEATWAGVEEFFVANCDSCHPSLNAPDLHKDLQPAAEAALADDDDDGTANWEDPDRDGDGVTNEQDDDFFYYYVAPGSPENSLLWQVLVGSSETVALMPFGAPQPLCEGEIGHIEEWIANGAQF